MVLEDFKKTKNSAEKLKSSGSNTEQNWYGKTKSMI